MGLMPVLEKAKTGDLIFLCSYGSGAGSDSFVLKVTKNLDKRRKEFKTVVDKKKYINYPAYLKAMEMI
jgi:hydroxymethylglutaryl-CoA synthase